MYSETSVKSTEIIIFIKTILSYRIQFKPHHEYLLNANQVLSTVSEGGNTKMNETWPWPSPETTQGEETKHAQK